MSVSVRVHPQGLTCDRTARLTSLLKARNDCNPPTVRVETSVVIFKRIHRTGKNNSTQTQIERT